MAWLKQILQCPDTYARFLNTLSMLEYMGARKIIKSQPKMQLTADVLAHIQEEIRHACVLKRAVLKIQPSCIDYSAENVLCGEEASHYLQTVDHAALHILGESNPWQCYLYTTYLIETRAIDIYAQLQQLLIAEKMPDVFRGILVEEEKHLQQIKEWLQANSSDYADNMRQLQEVEEEGFGVFVRALEENTNKLAIL